MEQILIFLNFISHFINISNLYHLCYNIGYFSFYQANYSYYNKDYF